MSKTFIAFMTSQEDPLRYTLGGPDIVFIFLLINLVFS